MTTSVVMQDIVQPEIPRNHSDSILEAPLEDKKDATYEQEDVHDAKFDQLRDQANKGEQFEHELTLWQALKYYKKAAFFSAVISMTIVMEAFDTSLGGSVAMKEFRKSFGEPHGDNDWQLDPAWQTALGFGPSIGQWGGIFFGSALVDRIGYRWSIIFNLILLIPLIAIQVFAINKPMLFMGAILTGVPFGAFQTMSEAYATEVAPLRLRAFFCGWINYCWTIGGLLAQGIKQGTQGIPSSYAWRIPYMCQWVWPIPLAVLIFFAPDSPWWLCRHNRMEEAEKAIIRLAANDDLNRTQETLAAMIRTTEFEKEQAKTKERGKWLDLFKGIDRRRTEITCIAWGCQNLCGSGFVAGTAYIMEQAGISQEVAFRFGFGSSVITVFANTVSFWLMNHFGRRTIYLFGLTWLMVGLWLIGGTAVAVDAGRPGAMWAQAVLQVIWNASYVAFLGPTCYAVVGEASSTRLRNKSISLGRGTYFLVGLPMQFINSYAVNPRAWNWAGKTAFLYSGTAAIGLIWAFFRLPEFKDRSYYELDILFARKTPARQFKGSIVEIDADQHVREEKNAQELQS